MLTNYCKLVKNGQILTHISFDDTDEAEIAKAWDALEQMKNSIPESRIVLGYPIAIRGPWSTAKVTWLCGVAAGASS